MPDCRADAQKFTMSGKPDPEQTLSLPYFKSFRHNAGPHWLFVGIEKAIALIELDGLQFPDLVAQMAGRKSDGCRIILYRSSADYGAAQQHRHVTQC